MVRAVRPAKSYLRSRALPAAAISRLLSDRGESVSTFVMTGLPMSLLGLSLLFSFQSLRAPCLSAEPYRRSTSSGRQKTHSVSGPQASSQSIGNYPIAPPRLSNRFRSSKDDYSTSPGPVKGLAATLCAISIHFRADPSPSPLGGALTLSCVEPHDSHHPGRSQAASDVGERYCSAV
jgi:hypothetical protein